MKLVLCMLNSNLLALNHELNELNSLFTMKVRLFMS